MSKVTVVGAGHVGEMTTYYLSEMDLAELVVIDIVEDMPQGKALDMYEGTPVRGSDTKVRGTNDWADIQGSDIVVVTAGLARKPGMSRDDLQKKNAEIIGDICTQIKERAPDAHVVMVTNPLDVMAYHAYKVTGFPANRVVGMAGVLDSTRFRSFIAMELNVSVLDVQAMVLGGHGDSMVPMVRHATVGGIPVTELIPKDRLEEIVQRTRMGGGEIVKLLKTGSAYYAPAASAAQMVDSILKNRRRILPCAAHLSGQYGMSDIYLGVPVILGANGVEEIIELDLTPEETEALKRSGEAVATQVKLL
ncbi:MAG: malate dehydrogenase [Candidatus Eisenbacteria bacterium]|nr:malate dehydrogenase [Candidatus Latescibacterota bacterium]MBD3303367.1 malate dehydrogenase [Candidatus Eisenbacteria bacterium]